MFRGRFNKSIHILPDIEMRTAGRTSLNRLCDISDWRVGGDLSNIMRSLNEGTYIHRKSWEYALCIYGLKKLGAVTPKSQAISVGAGYERPLYYFANCIEQMVATDLYDNEDHEGKPAMLIDAQRYAPFGYRGDHLKIRRMNRTNLEFDDEVFDFAFSL